MEQLIAHLFGDYVIQSHWMAREKPRRSYPAIVHAVTYGLPFLLLTKSLVALSVIISTHFVIDRWRLARYVIWIKNFMGSRTYWRAWSECRQTGYPDNELIWLTTWLYIVADNAFHLLINHLSIRYL